MKTLLSLLLVVACNNDSARVVELETALKKCSASQVGTPQSEPSDTMAASTEAANNILPAEITVGGRTYEVLPILQGKEKSVRGSVMVARAKEVNAHLGRDDGEHLFEHQADIPVEVQKVTFVFTDWPHPVNPGGITYVFWLGDRWVQNCYWLDNVWFGDYRVLRRKS